MEWFYDHFEGEGAIEFHKRISKYFVGTPRKDTQTWINRNEAHFKSKPILSNKVSLKPVTSKSVQGRSQIDLVDLVPKENRRENVLMCFVST